MKEEVGEEEGKGVRPRCLALMMTMKMVVLRGFAATPPDLPRPPPRPPFHDILTEPQMMHVISYLCETITHCMYSRCVLGQNDSSHFRLKTFDTMNKLIQCHNTAAYFSQYTITAIMYEA